MAQSEYAKIEALIRANSPAAKEARRIRQLIHRRENPEKFKKLSKESGRAFHFKRKREVMSHYGGACCVMCKTRCIQCLSIDHTWNDGAEHRREIGLSKGGNIYAWLEKNNYPKNRRLQVLCMNCQTLKQYGAYYAVTEEQAKARAQRRSLKIIVLNKYGGCKCVGCGFDEVTCLSLDHVLDDGAIHRAKIKESGGGSTYQWLLKNNFPCDPPLQVLCMNCQFLKVNKLLDIPWHGYDLTDEMLENKTRKSAIFASENLTSSESCGLLGGRVIMGANQTSAENATQHGSERQEKKRKPGRPRKDVCQQFKSISVTKELWIELYTEALRYDTTIAKIISNRLKNSRLVPKELKLDGHHSAPPIDDDGCDL